MILYYGTNLKRGVVANRLGNGLQNRIDRFDSGPRLHFFVFKKSFSKISEYSPYSKQDNSYTYDRRK